MNRLEYLRKTLPKNIEDNLGYRNIEFLLLNYNSKDNLDDWVNSEMKEYLDSGILKYYKTVKPKYFLMSHSKNVIAKKANGDIICNVDADNFIGDGFAFHINKAFQNNPNIVLVVDKEKGSKDCFGRICIWRDDFLKIKGYDESMKGYGFEDFDLRNRLSFLGRKEVFIRNKRFLNALEHDDFSRLENEPNFDLVRGIYYQHINHYSSYLLYLFQDFTFYFGKLVAYELKNTQSVDNIFQEYYKNHQNSLLENPIWNVEKSKWETGEYIFFSNGIKLIFEDREEHLYRLKNDKLTSQKNKNSNFIKCNDSGDWNKLIMFFSQINNCIKMIKNKNENKIIVNDSYGEVELVT